MTDAPEKPRARIIDRSLIETVVTLAHPIEYDGRIWSQITVSQPSVADVAAFQRRVVALRERGEPTDGLRLPMYDAPDEVLDEMRLDDEDLLVEAVDRFLPRRFRVIPESGSGSSAGSTSPTS